MFFISISHNIKKIEIFHFEILGTFFLVSLKFLETYLFIVKYFMNYLKLILYVLQFLEHRLPLHRKLEDPLIIYETK